MKKEIVKKITKVISILTISIAFIGINCTYCKLIKNDTINEFTNFNYNFENKLLKTFNVTYDAKINVTGEGTIRLSGDLIAGNLITINAKCRENNVLGKVNVLDSQGNEIETKKVDDTTYTFVMPNDNVTIEATFISVESKLGIIIGVSSGIMILAALCVLLCLKEFKNRGEQS